MLKNRIGNSRDVVDYLREVHFRKEILLREKFVVVYLNRSNHVFAVETISLGGQIGTVVDPAAILRSAVATHAKAVILAHNHPSGQHKPSTSDIALTSKIKELLRYAEITTLDHVIITDSGYYSFADEGQL